MITVAQIKEYSKLKESAPKDVLNDEEEETVILVKAHLNLRKESKTLDELQEVNHGTDGDLRPTFNCRYMPLDEKFVHQFLKTESRTVRQNVLRDADI